MQSLSNDLTGSDDGWSGPLFELELNEPSEPRTTGTRTATATARESSSSTRPSNVNATHAAHAAHLTPQPRLGSASMRDPQPTTINTTTTSYNQSPPAMSTGSPHPGHSSRFESTDIEDHHQQPTPPRDQHRRGYQACDPCRKRKVKCDLGSVDSPHDPPCVRCRREHKDCVFSATRRKRKPSHDADDASSDGGLVREKRRLTISTSQDDHDGHEEPLGYPYSYPYSSSSPFPQGPSPASGPGGQLQAQQQRNVTSQPFQPRSTNTLEMGMMIDSSPVADGLSSQARPSRTIGPNMPPIASAKTADEHMLNREAANILHPSIATSHEALHLLSVAAGQTEEASRQTSQSLPSHLRSPPMTLGTPTSATTSHRPTVPQHVGPGDHVSGEASRSALRSEPPGGDTTENRDYHDAILMWSKMRLVRDGWFSPTEAMAYLAYYYEHLAPMTPVVINDYRPYARHACLVHDEPILTITMMTIASRYMRLGGPGAIMRAYQIHEMLWDNLRGMVQSLVWGQEQFGGSLCSGGVIKTSESRTGQITWKGSLRTLGTIQALLLLTDWHPRALHFPPGDNDTRILDADFTSTRGDAPPSANPAGMEEEGRVAFSSWLEPAWRSDRMSWMLLGAAVTLSFELGVFDKEHYTCKDHHGPDSECAIKQQVRRMVLVYVSQTSGRLGFTPMLSFKKWQTDPNFEETNTIHRQGLVDPVELMHGCWMGIAGLMYKANQEIFLSKQYTRDLTSSGQYTTMIAKFKPMLQEWKTNFDQVREHFEPVMQHLLSMEYDYARLYINSLGLQKVVESWINISNEAATYADGLSNASHSVGVASAGSGGVTFSLLLDIWRPNKEYIDEVSDAARSLLKAVMEGLVPGGNLTHASVRSYSRILSGLMFTLKRFSFGASEKGVRESLTLLDSITDQLSDSVVDDVHLSACTADLVRMLSSHLRAKFIRLQAPSSGLNSNESANDSRQATPHAGHQHQRTGSEPAMFNDSVKELGRRHPNGQFVFNHNHELPLHDPLAGIQAQSMSDVSNISYMPPLNYNAYMNSNNRPAHNAPDFGGGAGDLDVGGDWFALPLDNFFSADADAAPVQQGFGGIGPTVGSKDMLELITNEEYDRWNGGDTSKQSRRRDASGPHQYHQQHQEHQQQQQHHHQQQQQRRQQQQQRRQQQHHLHQSEDQREQQQHQQR